MNNLIIHDCEQNSEEWFALRLGKMTASRAKDIIAMSPSGKAKGKSRQTYKEDIIVERKTRTSKSFKPTQSMDWGTITEPMAVKAYEDKEKVKVKRVGFCELSNWVGCSPDGLVDEDGGVEIKCPDSKTHYAYLKSEKVPTSYFKQIQMSLWVTGRKWWDFVSYDPRFLDPKERLLIIRVKRDEKLIETIKSECELIAEEIKDELGLPF
jgi:putative phage-type endonuclease